MSAKNRGLDTASRISRDGTVEKSNASSNDHARRPHEVRVWSEELTFPTYLPAAPDKNPMFLEKRVYQGSSGKVYPLPFTDRIAEKPVDRKWKAVWIENEFIRALVLPEIGGRIHALQDKTNGYDLLYNQPVIKPALVGLAGPWISGGIEFNWPQHHRPATFLPVDFEIEEHAGGSKTIWCSDHDPLARMKGMHGVCLHPGKAYLELKVRACNRTQLTQTFLWWANVATRVHEAYQSFFPPDVHYVADHARRSISEYPFCHGQYYGVNYAKRGRRGIPANEVPSQFIPPHARKSQISNLKFEIPGYAPNDLSFYANIPVPTSYMCMGSKEDFFGGYDHFAQAGIVHYANHHIAPGKKQWTWGNHEFGYAWDRNLTDADARGEFGPYIEIMAGVYTDNQPDFSFLQPGETKSWSQYWYPIRKIGPAQKANLDAAVSLRVFNGTGVPPVSFKNEVANLKNESHRRDARATTAQLGVAVTSVQPKAVVSLTAKGKSIARFVRDLSPPKPLVEKIKLPRGLSETDLQIRVTDKSGRELISYQPQPRTKAEVPPPASEPPSPRDIASTDELFITGAHLDQYRHATRCPSLYWREALRRDPLDSRCNNALGFWHLRRGEFAIAEKHFRTAIERITRRNSNPCDGEAHYNLGLCLRYQLDFCSSRREEALTSTAANQLNQSLLTSAATKLFEDAYAAFYKATWNQAWASAAFHALAEIDCCRANWSTALEHLNRSLRFNADNTRARNLKVLVLRKLAGVGQASRLSQTEFPKNEMETAATAVLRETLALDPLDWWARHLNGEPITCDLQTRLDLAHDFARAGFLAVAIELLSSATSPKRGERFSLSPGERAGVRASDIHNLPNQSWGAEPLVEYTLGWLHELVARASRPFDSKSKQTGGTPGPLKHYRAAAALPPDYCFPARLDEIQILQAAMRANPKDSRAPYYLGNLFYDRRRHEEGIAMWERSVKLNPNFSVAWRNLGLGYFNVRKQASRARAAYERAFRANSADARLLFERDQLWKRVGETPEKRLRELEKRGDLVHQRDDLCVELCALYNQTGQHVKAMQLISSRVFQPWEGGEGGPLGQHVRAHLALGRAALAHGDFQNARALFEHALTSPRNLGEAKHLLANQSDIHYWLGCALDELGEKSKARRQWLAAATFKGDFQEMRVRSFSEMTFYSALACERLGQCARAKKLFRDLLAYAQALQKAPAEIDYFATSLPTMLLFEDDLRFRQGTTALFLQAQAQLGLGNRSRARSLLKSVLKRDPNHPLASDLWRETAAPRVDGLRGFDKIQTERPIDARAIVRADRQS